MQSAIDARDQGRPLTAEELAWFYRVKPTTILKWMREGRLTSITPNSAPRFHPDIILQKQETVLAPTKRKRKAKEKTWLVLE